MAETIDLLRDEQELFDDICACAKRIHEYYTDRREHSINSKEFNIVYKEMALKAHKLHQMLKNRGLEPKHHKYMLKNREVPVDDEEFYNHIHAVEDLIAFVNDPNANNDPEDTTIGKSFKFDIFTRRWGHYDAYTLTRTATGWRITGGSAYNSNDCGKDGEKGVSGALDHDSANYPKQLGEYLEAIWNQAAEGADEDSVKRALVSLAEWVSICERSTPRIDILEGIL